MQSDPGGSGVGNKYRLGWKEECIDDDDDICEVGQITVLVPLSKVLTESISHSTCLCLSDAVR